MLLQNIKQIIKQTYLWESPNKTLKPNSFIEFRPPRMTSNRTMPPEMQELCRLMESPERCEGWMMLAQTHKHNYAIKSHLYSCIMDARINVHNLFLLLIQCKVLPAQVWIPIEKLCMLPGDSENELCCLIHYTVTNMGTGFGGVHNPPHWTNGKAGKELGPNFQKVYGGLMSLEQKIAILPMILVLNKKNSVCLWNKLGWLFELPNQIMASLRTNMRRFAQERISSIISIGSHDYFLSKLSIKAIQLLEMEGFVSIKNVFKFAYDLYNIPLFLAVLADYRPAFHQQPAHGFKLELIEFVIQLLECIQIYEFEVEIERESVEMANLRKLIVDNKLYMEELQDRYFNQQLQNIINKEQNEQPCLNTEKLIGSESNFDQLERCFTAARNIESWFIQNLKLFLQHKKHFSNQEHSGRQKIGNLAKVIPLCSSSSWLIQGSQNLSFSQNSSSLNGEYQDEDETLTPEQRLSKWMSGSQDGIIAHILFQLYHLKIDYLEMLWSMMMDCYLQCEEPWSQQSSSFYKLQLYLIKNHMLQFLVLNFNVLETKNNPKSMMCFYNMLGLVLRANPISYGVLDHILLEIESESSEVKGSREKSRSRNQKQKGITSRNLVSWLSYSFIQNMALSKSSVLMILSDQFEWHENEEVGYANSTYQSYFVDQVIKSQRVQWMISLITNISRLCPVDFDHCHSKQIDVQAKNHQKFEWVTLLLALHYYFEQTTKTRIYQKEQQRILTPNRAYLDKIMETEKIFERLYSLRTKLLYSMEGDGTHKLMCIEQMSPPTKYVVREERVLTVLQEIMEAWEEFYLRNSKKRILEYGFSFPTLRMAKKKLKSRIGVFMKAQQYEQKSEDGIFYFSTQS